MSTVIDSPERIERFKFLTLRAAVRLEALGLHRRGQSATAQARRALGLGPRASRMNVLQALNARLSAQEKSE